MIMNDRVPLEITLNDTVDYGHDSELQDFTHKVLAHLSVNHGVFEFSLVDSDMILELNMTHLSHDYVTDIISFNLGTTDDIEGDIYICVAKAEENALELGIDTHEEIQRLIVHGILHLLGHEDYTPDDQAKMFSLQESILEALL